MQDGTTLLVNGVSGSASGTTYLLQNRFIVQGNVTSNPQRGAGSDTGGTDSGNFSLRFGDVDLAGQLTHTAGGGGGSGTNGPHGVSGTITLDQSAPNTLRVRNQGGGNQGFTISGAIVDGAGAAGNVLNLTTVGETNTGRQFTVSGTGNTYAGGTIIEAASTAATALNAANGLERAIVVAANSALGTGNVTINAGALLTLQGSGNIADAATLTVLDGGFLHLSTGVNVEVDTLLAYQQSAAAVVSIGPGTYSVADLNTFFGNNSGGNASFYGLGDLTVIPEPSTYALIGGVFALGLVMLRRRRKA